MEAAPSSQTLGASSGFPLASRWEALCLRAVVLLVEQTLEMMGAMRDGEAGIDPSIGLGFTVSELDQLRFKMR